MRNAFRHLPPLIALLVAGDLALAAAYWANELLGQPRPRVTALLDLDGEGNLPAWFSSMQLFTIGILFASFAAARARRFNLIGLCLYALPAMFIAMSMDEVAQIHERIGNHTDALLAGGWRGNTAFARTGIWMFVIGIPFIAGFSLLLYLLRAELRQSPRATARFVLGMTVFLGGSLVMDALSNLISPGTRLDHLAVLVEESLKMFGETMMAWVALDLALARSAVALEPLTAGLTRTNPTTAPPAAAQDEPLAPVVRPLGRGGAPSWLSSPDPGAKRA